MDSLEANAQGMWVQKADFGGTTRNGSVGFSIGTKGYIGTGVSSSGYCQKDFWEWNQATNVWMQKANFGGTARYDAVGFSIGTKGYIGTGLNSTDEQDFWEWDQGTNIWTQKTNFGGNARYGAAGFSIGTKGYIGTGVEAGSPPSNRKDFQEWDQASNTWTKKADFGGVARHAAVSFSIGNKGYIGIGVGSGGYCQKDFWEWGQLTDTWTKKVNFTGPTVGDAIAFSIGAKGYIGTGINGGGVWQDFWEWDQATNTWIQKANFGGAARFGSVSFAIGSKGYVGIGESPPNITYRDFWEYDPNGITPVNESHSENFISVFPNPFSTQVTFTLNKEIQNALLQIYDVAGKEIKNINFSGIKISLEREKFPNGIYFYKIVSENKTITTGKLIVSDQSNY